MNELELLVAVINNVDKVDDVLEHFVAIGVKGATVIDSVGMGRMVEDIPIFAGLRRLVNPDLDHSKTIFSVIEDEATIERAVKVIEEVCGDLDEPDAGFIFTVPVIRVRGSLM